LIFRLTEDFLFEDDNCKFKLAYASLGNDYDKPINIDMFNRKFFLKKNVIDMYQCPAAPLGKVRLGWDRLGLKNIFPKYIRCP
jgi:hypothetical protein